MLRFLPIWLALLLVHFTSPLLADPPEGFFGSCQVNCSPNSTPLSVKSYCSPGSNCGDLTVVCSYWGSGIQTAFCEPNSLMVSGTTSPIPYRMCSVTYDYRGYPIAVQANCPTKAYCNVGGKKRGITSMTEKKICSSLAY